MKPDQKLVRKFACMKAVLRYVVLFGGIVLMINGCNGVISSRFGTHVLRSVDLAAVELEIGDADYVQLSNVLLPPISLAVKPSLPFTEELVLYPLFSPTELSTYQSGEPVSPRVIGWMKTGAVPPNFAPASAPTDQPAAVLEGTVTEPWPSTYANEWQDPNLVVKEGQTVYVHLFRRPQAWYWSLAMFLGGLLLAALPEALQFRRE